MSSKITRWRHRSEKNRLKANAASRLWKERNPEKAKRSMAESNYRKKYGIELSYFEELAAKGCMLCGARQSLVADHDHNTGKFRGVLCRKCNTGLGQFEDNPTMLLAAAEYLRRSYVRSMCDDAERNAEDR